MAMKAEDLDDISKYRQILKIPYDELVTFVIEYIRRRSGLTIFYWSMCLIFLVIAVTVRLNISGYFPFKQIFLHTILGLVVFPILTVPVHEFLHIFPFFITGAKNIRVGMDLSQYMFYVTAHRHVTSARQFILVAVVPFLSVSVALLFLVLMLPGLWKWSLSLLLFVHATMCAGDFAMVNFYFLNRRKKIYTWDDFDKKTAYFYEEL
jgi:hypothetical protein